ncbi:MAG: TfoX/Sxy family protein [Candidatus Bathyarchaeota archaeon]|nr:MAG: TfoX/Sxy family protein [Candidatus Bathyarchaeota archaeon]
MEWYNEEETKELRESVEKEILRWPQVTSKKMFGCPCYLANGKMFAGLVTKGIVITKLNSLEKEEIQKTHEIKPFVTGRRIIKKWVRINLDPKNLEKILPFVKKSYERALTL